MVKRLPRFLLCGLWAQMFAAAFVAQPGFQLTSRCGAKAVVRAPTSSLRLQKALAVRRRNAAVGVKMDSKDDEVRERLEDEIRDNTGAISYVFPRPVRSDLFPFLLDMTERCSDMGTIVSIRAHEDSDYCTQQHRFGKQCGECLQPIAFGVHSCLGVATLLKASRRT